MSTNRLIVTLDGPSGAGKSTVGRALARRLSANFVDTGLMYRALTIAAAERGVDPDDGPALGALAGEVMIEIRGRPDRDASFEEVLLDGRDVSAAVRGREVDRAVSAVSRHAQVRSAMVALQRRAATDGTVVMAGRDIGTVVVPDAELKVFLTAPPEVRAQRRAAEMSEPERVADYLAEIRHRDERDSERSVAPLRVPEGAMVIDTGQLDVEACVDLIVGRLRRLPAAR